MVKRKKSTKKKVRRTKSQVVRKKIKPESLDVTPLRQVKTKLAVKSLNKFKNALLNRRRLLKSNVAQMEEEALKKSRKEASGDLSNVPIHIADVGTDNFEQDFTLGLIENEDQELREIDSALERITDKTYGVCDKCSKYIPTKRLDAIPYARLCISCKEKEESE